MIGEKSGPLAGLTIIEMAGIGPLPLAGLMLSDLGAEVFRIERAGPKRPFLQLPPEQDFNRHGRTNLLVDLKDPTGVALVLRMAERADVLLEGYRPGVMERLGLGPQAVAERNPALIYGRMTGFGQHGPLAQTAGHDLAYLAWTGVLHAIGNAGARPVPPLNLIGDYGGGTMFLIVGILAALFERARSGKGQVINAAMTDGAAMLALPIFSYLAAGAWKDRRGANLLDSGAPFYDTYETSDGKHVAVACLEPQFFAEFARLLPLDPAFLAAQYDQTTWPRMREAIASRVAERPCDEWAAVFAGTDACVAPVLSLTEAADSDHSRARKAHVDVGGFQRPAPAPRFSRSVPWPAGPEESVPMTEIMDRFGLTADDAKALVGDGIARQ